MIFIPITASTHQGALREIERARLLADGIELRMDRIADGDLSALIQAARNANPDMKIIVTHRSPQEALNADGTAVEASGKLAADEKIDYLKRAAALKPDFIDVELGLGRQAIQELLTVVRKTAADCDVIVSYHDTRKTPSSKRLKTIYKDCVATGADVVKIVTWAQTPADNLKVLGLVPYAQSQGQKIIALCMGEVGKPSRVLAPLLGAYLTFAILPGVEASAPGQLTFFTLRDMIIRLSAESAVGGAVVPPESEPSNYMLLGNPVRHSLSPLMHNTALRALNLEGAYTAYCVRDIDGAVSGMRAMNIKGASVTIPFKESVMSHLDRIDPDALLLGAVNTIVNEGGRLCGYNTDWQGILAALKNETDIAGQTFVILGAGGTARAAAFGIQKEGGKVMIVNRSAARGVALAEQFMCPFYAPGMLAKLRADVLINTTPVGMFPNVDESPVSASVLKRFSCVMDVIYNPLKTRLLREAESQGCRIVSGLEMFAHQGALQFQLWTGKDAPLALMKKVVRERLEHGH